MSKKPDIDILLKKLTLSLRYLFSRSRRPLFTIISYIPLFVSSILCVFVLFSTFFNRIPTFSDCFQEKEYPITYNLSGTVNLFDSTGELIESEIEIFVGGYSITTFSSENFDLTFSSPKTNDIYVVFAYEINGVSHEYVELLNNNNNRRIEKEFDIYE